MTKQEIPFNPTSVEIVGKSPDGNHSLDLQLEFDGKTYSLTLATRSYLETLRKQNATKPTELQIDNNAYPLDKIPGNLEELKTTLNELTVEDVSPYLVEQD